jgi:hypothetical protein
MHWRSLSFILLEVVFADLTGSFSQTSTTSRLDTIALEAAGSLLSSLPSRLVQRSQSYLCTLLSTSLTRCGGVDSLFYDWSVIWIS